MTSAAEKELLARLRRVELALGEAANAGHGLGGAQRLAHVAPHWAELLQEYHDITSRRPNSFVGRIETPEAGRAPLEHRKDDAT
jgi:hypothetical protein